MKAFRQPLFTMLLVATAAAVTTAASAATVYVDPASATDGTGTQASPKKSISSAASILKAGDILILANGTYSSAQDRIDLVPAGNSSAWVTVRAASLGGARITTPLNLGFSNHYLVLDGLKFDSADAKLILGGFVKVFNTAFKGGPPTDNVVSVLVGSNDAKPGANNILLEDIWVYGPGGRYKILVYNAQNVVIRRAVTRHDGGWTDTKGDPAAGIMVYDSVNVSVQNAIDIDTLPGVHNFTASFMRGFNGTTGTIGNSNTEYRGCISIKPDGWGMTTEGAASIVNHTITDCAFYSAKDFAITQNNSGSNVYTRISVISPSSGTCYGAFGSSSSAVRDSLCVGPYSVVSAGNVAFSNSANYSTLAAAKTAGLSYIPRVEASSTMAGANQGARIVNRIGVSGTMFGETGYNTESSEPLWPYPNEARIKADFSENGVSRGLTATSKSLTYYIWELLGNSSPVTTIIPSAPGNFSIQ